jgi:hypothetical protein
MAGMTKVQRKYVEDIERNLNVKFTGYNTRKAADLFLQKYAEENKQFKIKNNLKFNNITGKQHRFIKDIETRLEIKFKGTKQKEASQFIADNLDEHKFNETCEDRMKGFINWKSNNFKKGPRHEK